ncbi:proton-coupled amino acid transporter 2-like [Bombus huntii]|uniref:proton-coupled amino acid transporter 2-like n=1 Tax=Bombus huntii TaxID=85661 RepID=UPI0021AADB7F|nr:proton-coupled amino acid transporter 2-like [Bombus huntii]
MVGVSEERVLLIVINLCSSKNTRNPRSRVLRLVPVSTLLFVINMMKYLHDIAVISIFGNLLLFTAAMIGALYAVKDEIGEKWVMIGSDMYLYPKFVGTVLFSMSYSGIVSFHLYSVQKPWNYTKFSGVLNHAMMHITLLHTFIDVVGYLKWGCDSGGNFIRNHPVNDLRTISAFVMQGLSIYFIYGLQCYMPIIILLDEYIIPALNKKSIYGTSCGWNLIVRLGISLITCLLAAIIPKLDLFIAVVGAVCSSTLSTIIPVTLYILIHYNNYGTLKWKLILGLFLLIVVNIILIAEYFRSSKLVLRLKLLEPKSHKSQNM